MIDGIMLGLSMFTCIFLIISLVFVLRLRKKEIQDVVLLFSAGLVFVIVAGLGDILVYADGVFNISFMSLELLTNGINLVIVPLAALCFLAALFVLKDYR